ncbi:MAG: glutamine synthetase family protein [Gammaproteobacteria bacterium]|nr:glutamine synthetase family protein [Gammaproteobacteria bacterium]MDH4315590.1 glutamine synthetase family protein [Gammaproteobacteria bacterium]MDH5214881.1 glutamine synthetase family protein [Gammaproteobacteria bacterium]
MTKRKASIRNKELAKFLQQHPETDVMELMIPDLAGVLRCKRVRAHEFDKVFEDGFYMPAGTVLLDTLGNTIPGIKFSADDGDPDTKVKVVAGSLAPVPWAKKPSAQALVRFETREGDAFFGDPRAVLERAAAPLYKMVSKIVTAVELEFYLLADSKDKPTAKVSRVPGTRRPQPGPQVYHPDDLWDIENFLNDLNDACAAQQIPIGTAISEFAPGQFEINLHHVADPVLACDHAVLLKRAVKAIARQHGFVACFMAKPFEDQSGSGMHIHMSLIDKNGQNYFSKGKEKNASPPFSAELRHAIGGLKKTMAEATAIFAPNANSYRRLRPEMFAPVEPNWGTNHRKVSLRVPISDHKNLRFEHRTSGADANPYLVTAAILAGVHYGLKNRCDPGKMVPEGAVIELQRKIPNRWDSAIDQFAASKILPEYLGEDYCKTYVTNRRDESRRFHNIISENDFDWYLRAV